MSLFKMKFITKGLQIAVNSAVILAFLSHFAAPLVVKAGIVKNVANSSQNDTIAPVKITFAGGLVKKDLPDKVVKAVITAYTSTPDQTDDTPFIAASGKMVHDGMIAANGLPFGAKIRIPSLYGDKIFVVEDRMNKRKLDTHIDIWFPTKDLAVNFGVKKNYYIEVLEN